MRVASIDFSFAGAYCIHELSQLLSCMKKHDFYDLACKAEHQTYYNCIVTERKAREEHSKAAREGKLGIGASIRFDFFTIHILLSRRWHAQSVQCTN